MICTSYRQWGLSAFLAFSLPLGAMALDALYDLHPCELCFLSRVMFTGTGIGFLILTGLALRPQERCFRVIAQSITFMIAILGLIISGRQLYLQTLAPPMQNGCAPSLTFLLENFTVLETIQKLWAGGQGCQTVDVRWFGISLAGYAVMFFMLLAISSLWFNCCKKSQ